MGGGGHSTETINNNVTENIHNIHKNTKNIDNYYHEHNIMTDIQFGDRALGGHVQIEDDVNTGNAFYKL